MSNNNGEESSAENDRVYQLRRRNFQKRLVSNLSSLGYTIIVLEYLKYGCSVWTLTVRVVVQAMLSAPFPNELHIRRLSSRNELHTSTYFPRLSMGMSSDATTNTLTRDAIPGGFPSPAVVQEPVHSEDQIKKDLEDVKRKIRKIIFHGSLTVNIFYILIAVLFPVNFAGKLEGRHLDEDGLMDTPSPFNNANGLVQGELKGGFFMQMIGELVPISNFKGNLGIILFQFGILVCQFGLFVLTCVNLADLGFEESFSEDIANQAKGSDGYDGKVFVAQIDPIGAIHNVLSSPIQTTADNFDMV